MIDIHYEEQYTLITVNTDEASEELMQAITEAVQENMEESNSNFILYMEALRNAPPSWALTIRQLNELAAGNKGILVVAAAPHALEDRLQEMEVVTTPTLEEASDYVFMEEIEKNFYDDEEE